MIETISLVVLAIGSIGTLIGSWYVFKTLKADHDWNRRKYAADFLNTWDIRAGAHFRAIEDRFPHLRDIDRTTGKTNEITREIAKQIYTCDPSDKDSWDLRFHIIELLNFLEDVTLAYAHNVADKEMLLSSVRNATIRWHDVLRNFVEIVELCEGNQPWTVFTSVVEDWKRVEAPKRKPTA